MDHLYHNEETRGNNLDTDRRASYTRTSNLTNSSGKIECLVSYVIRLPNLSHVNNLV